MKRIAFLLIVCTAFITAVPGARAQNQYSWVGTGSYTSTVNATGGQFPLFSTATHTVVGTASDSFNHALHSGYSTSIGGADVKSLNYTIDIYKIGGTPTVNVFLMGSGNYGATYDTVTSFTVVPGSTTVPITTGYIPNSGFGGNGYSDYYWIATGSASSTIKWHSDVLIR